MFSIVIFSLVLVAFIMFIIKWYKEEKSKVDDVIIHEEPEDYKNPFEEILDLQDNTPCEDDSAEPEIKTAEEYRSMDKKVMTDKQIKDGIDSYISFASPKGDVYASYYDSPGTDSRYYYKYIIKNKNELKSKGFTIKLCEATRFTPRSVALVWGDTSSDAVFNMLFTEEL